MRIQTACLGLVVVACLGILIPAVVPAAVTAEHKKQIEEVKKDVAKAQALIGKKENDEAEKLLAGSEQKLKQIAKDAGIDESNKLVAGLLKQIEAKRAALAKKQSTDAGGGGGGAFEKDVAPILVARCLGCHGDGTQRGGLRMDTFAGIVAGGSNGRVIAPGNANGSLLVQRITASGNQRMPRGGNPLTAEEIKKITAWIAGGAKFGGDNTMSIENLKADAGKVDKTPARIVMATGDEKVSFTRDIAPFMVNLCVGCHSGNGQGVQRTGLSLETFEKLMKGGRSGRVVVAGNLDDSVLWQRVGEQQPTKMPPGQALITRSNHANLRTWIQEGAKFDGKDAKAPLRSLVPTDEELRAKELAALSPEELLQRRKDQAADLWKKGLTKDKPNEYECDGFFVVGNAAETRLRQVGDWAEEGAGLLRRMFGLKDSQIWRGKLIVFVFADRFSYEEFTRTIERREVLPEMSGHARVSPSQDNAYICVQDIGDDESEQSPGLKVLVLDYLTEAMLQRSANKVPDWAARGTGLALAARNDPKNLYFRGLAVAAGQAIRTLDKPQEVFDNGKFSPGDLSPVGYSLVTFMLKEGGGDRKFVQFLDQMSSGKGLPEALASVYNADPVKLATAYMNGLSSAKPAPKKAKK